MDSADHTDALVIRYRPTGGHHQRTVFEPTSDGAWLRIEEARVGGVWRTRGSERVDQLDVIDDRPAVRSFAGP